MPSLRRSLWKVANRSGSGRLRSWAQNDQYRTGRWDYLALNRRPEVVDLVEKLADGGLVVEFGCGEGHLAAQVDPACYRQYIGYDLASVAVATANARMISDRCRFQVLDMATWPGDQDVSLIVAEECLYYLRPAELHRFLNTAVSSLKPGGAILGTFHSASSYPEVIDTCRHRFSRCEEIGNAIGSLFLIMRP